MKQDKEVLVVYQDEVTFYRQPSTGWLWSYMGRQQPKLNFSDKKNTMLRVIGGLNVRSGEVYYEMSTRVPVERFIMFLKNLSKKYKSFKRVYLVLDNWSVHCSERVLRAVKIMKNIILLPLPTYAPYLNYIEKVWKWLRQTVSHAHPWSRNFDLFKKHISNALDRLNQKEEVDILKYTGFAC